MIYVLGGLGFVGSAYLRLFQAAGIPAVAITRENYDDLRGSSCRLLINANGNSKKFLSTRTPLWDFDASVRSVAASLEDFHAERYVFLSSGDVYPDTTMAAVTEESQRIDISRISRYGLHKYLAEQLVQAVHPRWLVIRMAGFVGIGMRKNAIFDMLTGATVWLAPDSELQFIDTLAAARLVWSLIEAGIETQIVNIAAEGLLRLGDFHRRIGSASAFRPDAPSPRYELSLDRLRGLVPGPLPRTQDCVYAFADAVRCGSIPLV